MAFTRYMDIEVWNESTGQAISMRGPDYVTCPKKKPTAEEPECAPYRCSEQKVDIAFGDKFHIKGFLRNLDGEVIKEANHYIHLYVGACGKAGGGYVSTAITNSDGFFEFVFSDVTEPHYRRVFELAQSSQDPTFFVHNIEGTEEGYSAEVRIKTSWIPIWGIIVIASAILAAVGVIVGIAMRRALRR